MWIFSVPRLIQMIGCSTQLLITLVSLDSLRDLEADYFDGKVNFHPIESFALHVGIHISTFPGILLLFFKLLYQHSTMGSLSGLNFSSSLHFGSFRFLLPKLAKEKVKVPSLRPKAPEHSVVLWSPRQQHRITTQLWTDFLVGSIHLSKLTLFMYV